MLKLLTEYKQYVMVGISALLLIVFLAPSAVTQCQHVGGSPSSVWATTASGDQLTLKQLDKCRGEIAVLANLRSLCSAPNMRMMVGSEPGLAWVATTNPRDPEAWWLLSREAEVAGLVGGLSEGQALVTESAPLLGVPPEQVMGVLARDSRLTSAEVSATLSKLVGVGRLLEIAAGAPRASDARLRAAGRELLSGVSCDVVPLSAATLAEAIPVPAATPQQLEDQFKAGKDFLPGTGPKGAGYRIGDAVQVEWLVINARDIAKQVDSDPAMSGIELRKEFLRNPMKYALPAAPGATQVAPEFEAVQTQVRDAVRARLVQERVERIAQFTKEWNRAAVKDYPSAGGIVQLPADWSGKAPSLQDLAAELATRFKLPLPIPGHTGPVSVPVAKLADPSVFIAGASTSEFGQPLRIVDIVAACHELNPDSKLPVQVGVVGPVLTTLAGDYAIYRIRTAVPSHPPASLDEVRAAVERDVATALRFAELERMAPEILAMAEKGGLNAVANHFKSQVENIPQVSLANIVTIMRGMGLAPTAVSQAGSSEAVVRAIVQRAISLPADPPISAQPDSARMLTVAAPDKMVLLVVRINSLQPLSKENWQLVNNTGGIRRAVSQGEPSPDLAMLFGPDALKKRHGYTLRNPEGPDRPLAPQAPQF